MTTKAFDATTYKTTTRAQWQAAAEAWDRWEPTIDDWLGAATETMLDCARIGTGSRVLDVAAGAGGQTLAAARRVGPTGRVLATDIAPAILEYADARLRTAGFSNIETAEMDGEHLDVPAGSFDAVISRVGLIYFPDRQAALTGMLRALAPGGRVAAVSYSTPERNGFFSVPISVIREHAQLPPPLPGQPGPFSLGSQEVAEQALLDAGFVDVESVLVPSPRRPTACASSRTPSVRSTRCCPDSTTPAARRRGPRSTSGSASSTPQTVSWAPAR